MPAIHKSSFIHIMFLGAVAALFAVPLAPAAAAVCTLADHIRAANTNTAVGFCPAGASHDIITISEDITLTEPLPAIRGTITIEGNGHTISGISRFPIFVVEGGRLTINSLTLTKGYDNASGKDNSRAGGGLRIEGGAEVVINDSVLHLNFSANRGGAIGVYSSKLAVNNSSFVKNRAEGSGGAIAAYRSTVVIRNSSFVNNVTRPVQSGGAIMVTRDAIVDIVNSAFFNNVAGFGGAVATDLTGPFEIEVARTTLTHVTMVGNRAERQGESIWADENDSNFRLRNSVIVGSGPSQIRKSVVSCHGPLQENIGNFIDDGSCATRAGGDPMLAETTGSPEYAELLDGSPLLDAADPRFCVAADQLGTPRPRGEGCDIGAIESTTAQPAAAPVLPPPPCPLDLQIVAANTDAPAGGCPAGRGHDIIALVADIVLDAPLPPITSEITIEGNGVSISGDSKFGIFEVDGGALTISNLTLTKGDASKGGAILLKNGGRAAVADVTFKENAGFSGGAIATESSRDRLSVRNSSFYGNTAETRGGAISINGGYAEIAGSAFLDNRAESQGGAIATLAGRAAVSNSTVTGNAALTGGGIYAIGGETTLTHLTLMRNSAERVMGAGIYAEGGAVLLRNSLIAGNGGGDDCSGRLRQNRGNFSEDGSCAAQEGGDPMLADMTGSPAHYPLQDSSPAHGAADAAFCLPADQLGNPRTHCDSGAVETVRDPNYEAAPRAELPHDCSLADQIIAANTDQPSGACPAGDGHDVIRLRRNIILSEPLPTITSDIAIDGNGHTISGGNQFRIFDFESGTAVVKHISLVNGRNTGEHPNGYGGAVTVRKGAALTLHNVGFRNNKARMGGALAAIDLSHMYVFHSSFTDNEASSRGGALWRKGACGYFRDIVFRRNRAGELQGTAMDDYLTHIDGGGRTCTNDAETYTLSDR